MKHATLDGRAEPVPYSQPLPDDAYQCQPDSSGPARHSLATPVMGESAGGRPVFAVRRVDRLPCSEPPPVQLSRQSGCFVNDQSLRPVGFLARDDVISCPWPQSASVRIRDEQARSDPTRRHAASARCRLQSLHKALDHDADGRLDSTSSPCWRVHLRTHRLQTWQVTAPDVLTPTSSPGVLPLVEAPRDRR
jgi:hypothetical protein